MRSVNFSKESIAFQRQYLKRNLKELGILGQLDDFEIQLHRAVQRVIQESIYLDFSMQIGVEKHERVKLRQDERKGEYSKYFTNYLWDIRD